jgi:hypothetical protein
MPQNRVTMRKIREILRLAWSCNQTRQSISDSCGIGKTTVTDTLYRASAAGLSYPLPVDLDDERLERLLYPQHPRAITSKRFGKERLEVACECALFIKGVSYASIKSILNNNLDQKPLPKQQELLTVTHQSLARCHARPDSG